MKQLTPLMKEDLSTATRQSISSESQSYGVAISDGKLIHWTCVSAWRWSKYQGSLKLQTGIVLWIWSATRHLPVKWRWEQTGLIMAKITQSRRGVWCDYHKTRFGANHPLGQEQAVWTISSFVRGKLIERHYCFACAKEAQTWSDGTIWTFKEQIEYKEGKQQLDV